MEPALEGTEPEAFPEPSVWPEWTPFTRGDFALSYDPNASQDTETETETETETDRVHHACPFAGRLGRERSVPELLTVDAGARARPRACAATSRRRRSSSTSALGRVLREPARAAVDLPPFPSSAMDGFALRAAQTRRASCRSRFALRPAAAPPGPLPTGAAAGIATGGTVPDGRGRRRPGRGGRGSRRASVSFRTRRGPVSTSARAAATSAQARSSSSQARCSDPVQIGALAASGVASWSARLGHGSRFSPRATSSEARARTLEPGQIYESNRRMVAAALAGSGAEIDVLPVAADDEDSHRAAIERGLAGGRSRHLGRGVHGASRPRPSRRRGARVSRRSSGASRSSPGKPLAFGVRGETLVFGLPGNPVSSLVGALLFVRPALLARQGHARPRAELPRRAALGCGRGIRTATSSCAPAASSRRTVRASKP